MDPVFRRFFRAFRAVHGPGFEAEGEVRCWRGIANVDGSAGAQAAWKMPLKNLQPWDGTMEILGKCPWKSWDSNFSKQ